MKTTTVKCVFCGKEFDKPTYLYNWNEKNGMKHFCSRHCSASFNNKIYPKRKKLKKVLDENR